MTKIPVGTELSLRCRCRSSGIGTVRWIKNGATVRPVNGRISLDHRKLVLNNTSFADSGNYTCYVTIDKLGTAKSNKLEIWGKCNLKIVSITEQTVCNPGRKTLLILTLSLSCNAKNLYRIEFVMICTKEPSRSGEN